MTVIDVHTHMFTTRWLELLQKEGGQYNIQTRPDGQREIFRGNVPVVLPQKGHFDWELRIEHMNRAKAMKNLRTRLYDQQRLALDTARSDARKSQVGSGDRSERIRTYNYPQGRVTDHRINLTLHSLPRVLEGDLDELLDALIGEDEAARLSALEDAFA